ncbi:MAG: PIN domain-containing protein [Candidatus Electrothrix aestuarii]|jgi:predicted nucleic acid-binding protein|uniref:PIN domain-containing protein n=1 Tax=Candidatus Electrothrix aestuarii TaxID=3062594 RepID=A0AAU8LQJ0_9BACT|nr:PIN domain-containing protein [Candidatus Electrothrix aestuarii]
MILTDTGPLLALLDRRDAHHQRCLDFLRTLPPEPMRTTWPCFTEAMYLLGATGGYHYQSFLWKLVEEANLELHDLTDSEIKKMNALMRIYRDTPMDMADASLMAVAETMRLKQIFTIDNDFYIYRFADGSGPEVVP